VQPLARRRPLAGAVQPAAVTQQRPRPLERHRALTIELERFGKAGDEVWLDQAAAPSQRRPRATAMAIRGDRILSVGEERDVLECATATTRRIELAGKTVGYSTNGASTHITVLALIKHFNVAARAVATGAAAVTFTPDQMKTWTDSRAYANSPWSPPYIIPEPPPDGRWETRATFQEPGTYLLRAIASDGSLFTYEDVTVIVTR